MKPESSSKPTTPQSRIRSAVFCLVAILIATIQTGCYSTGANQQQVYRPPTTVPGYNSNPAWGNQQGAFGQPQQGQFGLPSGGSGTSFQGNQGGQFGLPSGGSGTSQGGQFGFPGGGSGTSSQFNPGPFGFNGGGSGTNFQANSGSGTRPQFSQTGFNSQQGFNNPFGFGKTSC